MKLPVFKLMEFPFISPTGVIKYRFAVCMSYPVAGNPVHTPDTEYFPLATPGRIEYLWVTGSIFDADTYKLSSDPEEAIDFKVGFDDLSSKVQKVLIGLYHAAPQQWTGVAKIIKTSNEL